MVIAVALFIGTMTFAQNEPTVTVSGVIFCEDSIMGTLPDVAVYNKNRKTGTISNSLGEFSIKMAKNDTLIFSTVQHSDAHFFFSSDEKFADRVITVAMEMDNIYIDVVSVMGKGNYEQFKRELMALDLTADEPDFALPIVNKYALEYKEGEGAIKIRGPLTYLSNKIRTWKKRKYTERTE